MRSGQVCSGHLSNLMRLRGYHQNFENKAELHGLKKNTKRKQDAQKINAAKLHRSLLTRDTTNHTPHDHDQVNIT